MEMAVTFKWIINVVVQRNTLPRLASTTMRTSKLHSREHILRAEAVGTPYSSILSAYYIEQAKLCCTTVCIWLVAVSKHFPVHRNQSWLRSENLASSRSPAISYMRCCG